MELDFYRNFIAIVDCGNLSAAAERLHIAQPALTAQLKNLQKKYGVPLLKVRRGARSVELTEAGQILYNKAKYLCAIEESTRRDINSLKHGYSGKLAISLSPSMSMNFIKNSLSAFARENPQIEYALYEVGINEQTEQLLNGVTEIGVANAKLKQPSRFETLITKTEALVAVFHPETDWVSPEKKILELDDLEDIPLCLSRGCSEQFLTVCRDTHIYPRILAVNTTKMSTLMWAQEKIGVAIVPAAPGENLGEGLCSLRINDERMYLEKTMSVVKGRPLSAAARRFISYYTEHF